MADALTLALIVLYFVVLVGIGSWPRRRSTTPRITSSRKIARLLGLHDPDRLLDLQRHDPARRQRVRVHAGWPGIWEQIFVPLAAAFCIIFFGVKLQAIGKNRGYLTVQDYLAERFESPRPLRGLSAVAGIVVR
jgi:SSS family solute:Na+ symporter